MILLGLILGQSIVNNGKYFLIQTGKNETSKGGLETEDGSGCQPARINSRKEVCCGIE